MDQTQEYLMVKNQSFSYCHIFSVSLWYLSLLKDSSKCLFLYCSKWFIVVFYEIWSKCFSLWIKKSYSNEFSSICVPEILDVKWYTYFDFLAMSSIFHLYLLNIDLKLFKALLAGVYFMEGFVIDIIKWVSHPFATLFKTLLFTF